MKELQHAALIQKPIVPVVFTSDIEIPSPLNSIQYVLFDESPESGAKLVRALTDPRPLSQNKIPANWERLGGGPMGLPTNSQTRFPIPRIKHELTDMEKEDFLYASIKKIRNYFSQALSAFEKSDTRIQARIRDESNTVFKCEIYLDGQSKKSCRIWIGDNIGLKGIAYSESRGRMVDYGMNSYNSLATVSELDGEPALEFGFGLGMFNQPDDCKICTVDKAAECLWRYFTSDFGQETSLW